MKVFLIVILGIFVVSIYLNQSHTNNILGEQQSTWSNQQAGIFSKIQDWWTNRDNKQTLPQKEQPKEAIKLFKDPGGRVDWSKDGSLLVFDKKGSDGYYDAYIADLSGSNERCLTCNNLKLPKHNGNPAFSPDGKYIVFQAQAQGKGILQNTQTADWLAAPGRGTYNNLWVVDSQGNQFWQLTDLKIPAASGVLHPHFSHDGKKLFWSQRVGPGGPSGIWALKVADFSAVGSNPKLINIKTYQPGAKPRFYESHGFSQDNTKIIFSGNPDNQTDTGFDIYTLDLINGELKNLTNSPSVWDEHAQFSPDGSKIFWVSNQDEKGLKLNLWEMDSSGNNKRKLLRRSDGSVADNSWSPDGKRLVFYLITDNSGDTGKNYILDLN